MKQSSIFFLDCLYPLLKCRWAKNDGIILFVWTIPNFVLLLLILMGTLFCFGRLRCCHEHISPATFLLHGEILHDHLLFSTGKLGKAPSFNECLCPVRLGWNSVDKKCSEQQNLFPTVAKYASPRFIRISHVFLACLSEGNSNLHVIRTCYSETRRDYLIIKLIIVYQ